MHGGAIWRAQVHVEQVQVQSGGGRPAAAPVIREKPRNCSCGARSSAVSSCQSSAPRCRTGPNPGHVRPFFYVPGPAGLIYLHRSAQMQQGLTLSSPRSRPCMMRDDMVMVGCTWPEGARR